MNLKDVLITFNTISFCVFKTQAPCVLKVLKLNVLPQFQFHSNFLEALKKKIEF